MKGRCKTCSLEVDSEGCRIVSKSRGRICFLSKDGRFHDISAQAEKKVVDPAAGVGEGLSPAAAKYARLLARQAAQKKEQEDGN
jgi:hypothetical protein